MGNPRQRAILFGLLTVAIVWVLAWGGYRLASGAKMTPEKFAAHLQELDLSALNARDRARALRDLADQLNRLDREDRRRVRLGRELDEIFGQMTEEERGQFLEATLPTGFKQALASFEELPEDRRHLAITNALERLRRARDEELPPGSATNQPPVLSEELQRKVVAVGLQTFYSESSAATKAELAPVLEELQRMMESGRMMRRPR